MDTEEYGKMSRRILILEDRKVRAKNAKGWQMEEQKKKSHWEGMQKGFGKSLRWEFHGDTPSCVILGVTWSLALVL